MTAYFCYTTTTLSRHLHGHAQQGSIKEHLCKDHNIKATEHILHNNTNIIATTTDRFHLAIKEALQISKQAPVINKKLRIFLIHLNFLKISIRLYQYYPSFWTLAHQDHSQITSPWDLDDKLVIFWWDHGHGQTHVLYAHLILQFSHIHFSTFWMGNPCRIGANSSQLPMEILYNLWNAVYENLQFFNLRSQWFESQAEHDGYLI